MFSPRTSWLIPPQNSRAFLIQSPLLFICYVPPSRPCTNYCIQSFLTGLSAFWNSLHFLVFPAGVLLQRFNNSNDINWIGLRGPMRAMSISLLSNLTNNVCMSKGTVGSPCKHCVSEIHSENWLVLVNFKQKFWGGVEHVPWALR